MKIEDIARVCHEANRALCVIQGDYSQPPWDEAPAWQLSSGLKGVVAAQGGAGPEASHEGWLREKKETGWVWGEQKDPTLKTHPCMVPYEQLPEDQQIKDHLFVAIVRVLSGRAEPDGAGQDRNTGD